MPASHYFFFKYRSVCPETVDVGARKRETQAGEAKRQKKVVTNSKPVYD